MTTYYFRKTLLILSFLFWSFLTLFIICFGILSDRSFWGTLFVSFACINYAYVSARYLVSVYKKEAALTISSIGIMDVQNDISISWEDIKLYRIVEGSLFNYIEIRIHGERNGNVKWANFVSKFLNKLVIPYFKNRFRINLSLLQNENAEILKAFEKYEKLSEIDSINQEAF